MNYFFKTAAKFSGWLAINGVVDFQSWSLCLTVARRRLLGKFINIHRLFTNIVNDFVDFFSKRLKLANEESAIDVPQRRLI